MANLLLLEDDETLGMSIEVSLQGRGHTVHWCRTIADAQNSLHLHPPDLFLLDLGLPDGDGLTFCQQIRRDGNIQPILILTARETLHDRVAGLNAGADDYLGKPFDLPEFFARVDALLRRQRWHGPGDQVCIGHLSVDFQRRQADRDGVQVDLTDLEFRLLRYLLDRSGQIVSREELLTRVWHQSPNVQTRTVDVFIARLRRHIEEDTSSPRHILNVRGVGYRLLCSKT